MPRSAVVPCPSPGSSTTAPAPSPNSTQVPRSVQSISRVMVSAPITRRALRLAAGDEVVGHRQRVDEARADRLHVEGDADRAAQLALHDGRGGREGQVGRGGADDDQVDVGRRAPGGGQRLRGGARRRGRRSVSPSTASAALADAGALDDPGVAGVDDLGQVVVGDDARRQIVADAGDDATKDGAHALVLSGRPRRRAGPLAGIAAVMVLRLRSIWATKSLAARSAARRMAVAKSSRVGAAVAFDYNPVQSEERPAVDRAGIELLAPCAAAPPRRSARRACASGPEVKRRAQLGAEDSAPGPRRSSAPHCR